ncbi:DUF2290 domain-containing protein [Mycolicibacterium llatzerense]|uniref:DUF2290 domain-containing protein n=1 Tax=Mycolicibacterium llatzerense TaxID=280871 RepID=UPI0012FF5644|nr:DUF2290 domain-containing protein [Mycolicibacterium llatzerense]
MSNAELLLAASSIAESAESVTWHAFDRSAGFLTSRDHVTADQYLSWIRSGHHTCVLLDGSLLQLTYNLEGDRVVKHRLAYVPCPWKWDSALLDEGYSLEEILELHSGTTMLMRSSVRFDLDVAAAKSGHPASHFTFNTVDCRIACAAPLHPLRFADFVFKNFYPLYWRQHLSFFDVAKYRHLGDPVISPDDLNEMHVGWNYRLRALA